MKKIKIFVCCTEQSGENICSNILSRMNIDKYQFDGVCGKQSEKYISNKIYDLSEFKSIGLFEIILSISKYLKMIRRLKNYIIKNDYDLILDLSTKVEIPASFFMPLTGVLMMIENTDLLRVGWLHVKIIITKK